MARALIRLSLWALLAVLILAFVRETLDDGPLKVQTGPLLTTVLITLLFILAASLVLKLVETFFGGKSRGRCATCRRRISKGDIYCRDHLRDVVLEETDRAHEAG
jgi:hypothetical protein